MRTRTPTPTRLKRVLDKADIAGSSEPDAITLSDVRVVWSTGDGVTTPTLRLSVDAVAAWWLGWDRSTIPREQGLRSLRGCRDSARLETARPTFIASLPCIAATV